MHRRCQGILSLNNSPAPRTSLFWKSPKEVSLGSSGTGTDCLCCALQPWPVETATCTVLILSKHSINQWPFLLHPGFPWMLFSLCGCQRRRALISASRNSSCWKYWAKGISWVYVRTEFGREVWKCTISSMYVMYIINHCSTVSCWTYRVWMYVQSISLESCLPGTECGEGGARKIWPLFFCIGALWKHLYLSGAQSWQTRWALILLTEVKSVLKTSLKGKVHGRAVFWDF